MISYIIVGVIVIIAVVQGDIVVTLTVMNAALLIITVTVVINNVHITLVIMNALNAYKALNYKCAQKRLCSFLERDR